MKHMTSWISYLVAMFLFTTCADLKTNSIMIEKEPFGLTNEGKQVDLFKISHQDGMIVTSDLGSVN